MSGPVGGAFGVDLASVQQLIKDLTHERSQLEDLQDTANELTRVSPPGADPVSMSAMQFMSRKVGHDNTSYLQAVRQLADQLDEQITKLHDTVRAYQAQDEAGAHRLSKHRD